MRRGNLGGGSRITGLIGALAFPVAGRYVSSNLDGVHAGCALVDRTLSAVDPVLSTYLESKFLSANIYAFPLVMSLHACIPPLEEVVKLWDAVFSFGVHLEVLICVAQVKTAAVT